MEKLQAAKPKIIKLKNMSSKKFMEFISHRGACSSAREWAEGKDLRTVLKTCKNYYWLWWLFEVTTRDRTIWNDDGNEVFIPASPEFGTLENFQKVLELAQEAADGKLDFCKVWRKYYKVEGPNVRKLAVRKAKPATRSRKTAAGKGKAVR